MEIVVIDSINIVCAGGMNRHGTSTIKCFDSCRPSADQIQVPWI